MNANGKENASIAAAQVAADPVAGPNGERPLDEPAEIDLESNAPTIDKKSPWNSLELVKVLVTAAVPISVFVAGTHIGYPSKSGLCRIAANQPREGSTGTRPLAAVRVFPAERQCAAGTSHSSARPSFTAVSPAEPRAQADAMTFRPPRYSTPTTPLGTTCPITARVLVHAAAPSSGS